MMPGARKSRYEIPAGRDRVDAMNVSPKITQPQGGLDRARVELGAVVAELLQLDPGRTCATRLGSRRRSAGLVERAQPSDGRCGECGGCHAGLLLLRRRRACRRCGGGTRPRASRPVPSAAFSSSGVPVARIVPAVHERDPVAQRVRLLHVVGGHAARSSRTARAARAMVSQRSAAGDRVEADRRLVQHQQARPVDERLGELEPPDHAARVRPAEPVGAVAEPHRVERRRRARCWRSRRGTSNSRANSMTFSRPVSVASADSCCGT